MDNMQSYDDAFKELEEIMNAMQNDEITVDDLAVKVERATVLIKFWIISKKVLRKVRI